MAPLHIAVKKENYDIIKRLFLCENLDFNVYSIFNHSIFK